MSYTAKALGKGAPFEFEGVSYTIAPWVQDVQAEYEMYIIGRAYANLRAARKEMPDDEYREERASLRRDIDSGLYEFGKPLLMNGLGSRKNQKELLYLCMAYAHRGDRHVMVTKDLIDRIDDNTEKFVEALDIMAELNRDPNLPPAGEPPATGQSPEKSSTDSSDSDTD